MLVRTLAFFALSAAAHAQLTLTGPVVIPHPSGLPSMYFGVTVVSESGMVLVAVPTSDFGATDAGEALLYTGMGTSWTLAATLRASPPVYARGFGRAIDLSSSRIVVSDSTLQSAHVFDTVGGSWSEVGTLVPSTPMQDFGLSVEIFGASVLVGAPESTPGLMSRVAQFNQTGPFWFQGADLTPPGGATDDYFGFAMASSGTTLAVSAILSDIGATNTGSILIFVDNGAGLVHEQTIWQPGALAHTQFGIAFDIDDNTLIVGQPNTGPGRAFVYTRNAGVWALQQELLHPDGPQLGFGGSVQVAGDIAAVYNPSPVGVALYRRQEGVWSWKMSVPVPDPAYRALALASNVLAVGSPFEGTSNQGIVRVFGVSDLPAIAPYCFGDNGNTPCPCGNPGSYGCANSAAVVGAGLFATGDASVAHDTVRLTGSWQPPNATGLYFQGTAMANLGFGIQFGDGLRCVGGTNLRLAVKTASGGVSGYPDAGDQPITVVGMLPGLGATRYYQLWYRDVAQFCTPSGFNLTNGLRIVWTP